MPRKFTFRRYRTALLIGFMVLVFLFMNYISWPYVLYGPGSAEPVHPRVETGHKLDEKGQLLFTTVSTYSRPNLFAIIYAWWDPRMDIETQEKATGGATNLGAYRNLLAWMRDSSEANALIAAYNAMKRPIDVKEQGVIVVRFLPETKARESGLQEGDIITSIDGKQAKTVQELVTFISSKKPGDKVKVAGKRGKESFSATVPLILMPQTNRTGIGFQNDTVLNVTPPDPVKFDFEDTGGPSAGLMMTLEIVAQLTGEDLTRGYRIAGTGTIDAEGKVGQIGGIQYKLMAADREKADYFLVPYDEENGLVNWKQAQETVKELELKPKLVPVADLAQAMEFLEKLQPKR
ncbi:YlbL family protein [Cohnella kolymensis]|uniref:YlbL family protein n=1 Tax=Cohnella kolymensis TaxID=1590652 RepID=UPI0006976C1F|nr:PDZ domain-containing protein [Cohnella kolymensis]